MAVEERQANQQLMSGRLLLLHELGTSDINMPYIAFKRRPPAIQNEMLILNTIATLLSSGLPGDATAAAFDKRQGLTLVLAKNGVPTARDIETTHSLISNLLHPSTHNAIDMADFLLSHCCHSMQKRILGLHHSISDFYTLPPSSEEPSDFEFGLSRYIALDMRKEFPRSGNRFTQEDTSFKDVIRGLFERCIEQSSFNLDPSDSTNSMRRYEQLYRTVHALLYSRFLGVLCSDPNKKTYERRERAMRLKRRLAKIHRYYGGVYKLIKAAKRRFKDDIPFLWVDSTLNDTSNAGFYLNEDHFDVVRQLWSDEHLAKIKSDLETVFATKFPNLARNWANGRYIKTTIHAEIRIVLHFHKQKWTPSGRRLIGCSKQSCLSCTSWMYDFDVMFGTDWMISGSNGKPCADWELPNLLGVNSERYVDAGVVNRTRFCLVDVLSCLLRQDDESDSDFFDDWY